MEMIWPLGLVVQTLTSNDDAEISICLMTLQKTHADTGFMHEAFHKDNPEKIHALVIRVGQYNFLGELILKVFRERLTFAGMISSTNISAPRLDPVVMKRKP